MYRQDIGVLEGTRQPCLVQECSLGRRLSPFFGTNALDADFALQISLQGAVDDIHAASPEKISNLEALLGWWWKLVLAVVARRFGWSVRDDHGRRAAVSGILRSNRLPQVDRRISKIECRVRKDDLLQIFW